MKKTPESPLDCKIIKPINSKGNQLWLFIGRTTVEGEAPIRWPRDAKRRLIRKGPDAGKDWGQVEKGETEDEMVGWHHRLNGHEFEQTLGDSEERGSLVCCSPWGHRVGHDLVTQQEGAEELKNNWWKKNRLPGGALVYSLFISSMTAAPSWALNLSPRFPFNTWLVTFSISSSHFQGCWFRVSLLHLLPEVCIPWMGSFHSLPWWTHLPTASLCCQGKHPETQPSLFRLPLISRGLLGEIHIQKALCSGKHGSPHQAHLPSSLSLHMGHLSDSARHTTSWSFHSSKPLNEALPLQNILLQHSPPLLLQFAHLLLRILNPAQAHFSSGEGFSVVDCSPSQRNKLPCSHRFHT